jgi:hypothetical protein
MRGDQTCARCAYDARNTWVSLSFSLAASTHDFLALALDAFRSAAAFARGLSFALTPCLPNTFLGDTARPTSTVAQTPRCILTTLSLSLFSSFLVSNFISTAIALFFSLLSLSFCLSPTSLLFYRLPARAGCCALSPVRWRLKMAVE